MVLPYQLHQKVRQSTQKSQSSNNSALDILKDKPFWIWDREEHLKQAIDTNQQCCFNHICKCPVKSRREYPLFDYQKLIFDLIENNQNIWIKKARGIGVTTFFIRYLVWKILSGNELDGKSIFIISGTREEFANYVKKKMEDLFLPRFPNVVFDSKYTELTINKTWIKVMPTKNIKDVRGYMDVAYLFIDEADHFDKSIQEELEPAITAYEEKSNGKTIMVSTPNRPGGLFERIEKDKNSKYKKLFLDYTYGLDKIYDRAFIEKKKLKPEFDREYNLRYLGRIGNLLSQKIIDDSIELGERFSTKHLEPNPYAIHSLGVDPAFGSSAFGMVLTEHIPEHDIIRVLYSEQFDNHPDPNDMIERIFEIHRQYHNLWIFVDAAARGFITSLKIAFGENINYQSVDEVHPGNNKVLPISFAKEHKTMITHLVALFEDNKIAVPQEHDKLIIALKTAVVNEYSLDKEQSSYHDLLDATRLSLRCYKIS